MEKLISFLLFITLGAMAQAMECPAASNEFEGQPSDLRSFKKKQINNLILLDYSRNSYLRMQTRILRLESYKILQTKIN